MEPGHFFSLTLLPFGLRNSKFGVTWIYIYKFVTTYELRRGIVLEKVLGTGFSLIGIHCSSFSRPILYQNQSVVACSSLLGEIVRPLLARGILPPQTL